MVIHFNSSQSVQNPRRTGANNPLRPGQWRGYKNQSVFNQCKESALQHAEDLNKGYGYVRQKMLENMSPEEREKFLEREKNTSLEQRMDILKMTTETLTELNKSLEPLDEKTDTITGEAPKMQE